MQLGYVAWCRVCVTHDLARRFPPNFATMTLMFEEDYPTIARWLKECNGQIEIGYRPNDPTTSFIRAIHWTELVWEGEEEYAYLDEALEDLEMALGPIIEYIFGS